MLLQFIKNRTSTYLIAVLTTAFFVERTVQIAGDAFWDHNNKGVSIFHQHTKHHSVVLCGSLHNHHQFWNLLERSSLILPFSLQKQWKDIESKYT